MRGKIIHIEDIEEGWVFFKYERLPTFCYWCGILGHQDRECQQINKRCLHMDEDEFQYGPWMHTIAPKINQKKGSPSQPRSNDDEEEVNLATEGEENIDGPSKLHQQKHNILLASESIVKICRQQLDDSGHSENKISIFF